MDFDCYSNYFLVDVVVQYYYLVFALDFFLDYPPVGIQNFAGHLFVYSYEFLFHLQQYADVDIEYW